MFPVYLDKVVLSVGQLPHHGGSKLRRCQCGVIDAPTSRVNPHVVVHEIAAADIWVVAVIEFHLQFVDARGGSRG